MARKVIAEIIVALQATHLGQGGRVVLGGAGDLGEDGKGGFLVVDLLGMVVVGRDCLCRIVVGAAVVKVEFRMVSVTLGLICHAGPDVAAFGTNGPEGITSVTEQ